MTHPLETEYLSQLENQHKMVAIQQKTIQKSQITGLLTTMKIVYLVCLERSAPLTPPALDTLIRLGSKSPE